jgi:redox-sensitive bicupin YhaK (pirin superfamily)
MPIVQALNGRVAEIAPGNSVRRVLPAAAQRSVGPFVFFDHFGPAQLSASSEADVGPHPHIGLATVTYLLDGEMVHRDSIGSVQSIRPGDINWMTAGSGIVHSERVPDTLRRDGLRLEGLQLWVALPQELEDAPPSFQHAAASTLPAVDVDGIEIKVLVGSAFGASSPVATASRTLYLDLAMAAGKALQLPAAMASRTLYLDLAMAAGKALQLPATEAQLAVYLLNGTLSGDGTAVEPCTMAVLEPGVPARLSSGAGCRLVVIGGDALAAPVHMWWNFVSADRAKIERAAERWEARQFPAIDGETDLVRMPPLRRMRE